MYYPDLSGDYLVWFKKPIEEMETSYKNLLEPYLEVFTPPHVVGGEIKKPWR